MKAFALALAKEAGNYLLRNFRKNSRLEQKRTLAKEMHLIYDQKSDRIISAKIKAKYPSHNILSEESGLTNRSSKYTWIIDPLDGTSNFANGNPFFAVSIALMEAQEVILGVVYAPFLKELYVAEKNKGAYIYEKNGKKNKKKTRKLQVSKMNNLADSYIISCGGGEKTNEKVAALYCHFYNRVKEMRKLGSAALESAYIAAGRAEAYIVATIQPWDVAAGALLIKEAGGKVTDFKGCPWNYKTADLVFSNGIIHEQVLKEIKKNKILIY
ncbi:MAG: inositol monophosphatase [Nanoarchaeota archaeon]